MQRFAPFFIFVIGCGQSVAPLPPRSRLVLSEFELREDEVPTRVVIVLENRGDAAAFIDALALGINGKSVLHDDDFADRVPPDFDLRTVWFDDGAPLADGDKIEIRPGESVEFIAELQWQLPDDAPPMLAIIQAKFALTYQTRARIVTEPAAFIMQSRPGALDSVVNATADNGENDRKILALLNQHTGTPSPGFTALRNRLRGEDTF